MLVWISREVFQHQLLLYPQCKFHVFDLALIENLIIRVAPGCHGHHLQLFTYLHRVCWMREKKACDLVLGRLCALGQRVGQGTASAICSASAAPGARLFSDSSL